MAASIVLYQPNLQCYAKVQEDLIIELIILCCLNNYEFTQIYKRGFFTKDGRSPNRSLPNNSLVILTNDDNHHNPLSKIDPKCNMVAYVKKETAGPQSKTKPFSFIKIYRFRSFILNHQLTLSSHANANKYLFGCHAIVNVGVKHGTSHIRSPDSTIA